MIKDMCRNFAETELKPTAGKNDQNHTFPGNEIKKLGELGMVALRHVFQT
jgi:butyryl-CoA dehydrogenase